MQREMLEQHKGFVEKAGELGLIDQEDEINQCLDVLSGYLPNNQEALMRLSLGLQVAGEILMGKTKTVLPLGIFYQTLSSLAFIKAVENGLDLDSYRPVTWDVAERVGEVDIREHQVLTIQEASKVSKKLQDDGLSVGLLHGHFRLFTPSSMAFIINAHRYADVVLLGMERGERSERYKGKPIFTDSEREKIARTLLPFVFWIDDDVEYSDNGYLQLCQKINPRVYFGQSSNSSAAKQAMKLRAEMLPECEYREITHLPGLSTTKFMTSLKENFGDFGDE